jgi:6-phosphofructokinase 1
MEAFHAYNVPSILGIPYGLEGFIPKYGHVPVELTPSSVSDIHRFGGTMLGSSRGPQSPEEIVDTLERSNVNVLFVIGGDGTMKAALAISSEVQSRGSRFLLSAFPKQLITTSTSFPSRLALKQPPSRPQRPLNAPTPRLAACPTALGWSN